ncbi:TIGR00282 family metallophosphoesterase [Alicyclobacillus sp. SO9]|uniref:TIGR00282 family metallophosphoesterase n=1 Tax=Alicyclobacillus sp. SO9 TaxID=2665646 RepID=UPI00351C3CED
MVGKPGVDFAADVLGRTLPALRPDLVIANGENAYSGRGLVPKIADQLYDAGIEIVTMGNHTWDRKEIVPLIDKDERIVRPANYPDGTPGRGYTVCRVGRTQVLIVNVMGQTFLSQLDSPFSAVDKILREHQDIRHIIVDMHAETTSEKLAMGWYLDGRVSAVVGTHTHVPTADERILPKGSAYISDVGMVGPRDGILGMNREAVLKRLTTHMPQRFEVAPGPRQFCSVLFQLDDESGKALSIERMIEVEGD